MTGECIAGDLEGKVLELYPSVMMTFADFAEAYPDGKLLRKPEPGPDSSPYSWYADDTTALSMFGRADDFERLKGKDIVYGLRIAGRQVAIAADLLDRERLVKLAQFTSPAVVIGAPGGGGAAFSWEAEPDLMAKLALVEDTLIVAGSEMRWNAGSGRSLNENADDLPLLPMTSAYWFAWVSFFPNTELVK